MDENLCLCNFLQKIWNHVTSVSLNNMAQNRSCWHIKHDVRAIISNLIYKQTNESLLLNHSMCYWSTSSVFNVATRSKLRNNAQNFESYVSYLYVVIFWVQYVKVTHPESRITSETTWISQQLIKEKMHPESIFNS